MYCNNKFVLLAGRPFEKLINLNDILKQKLRSSVQLLINI